MQFEQPAYMWLALILLPFVFLAVRAVRLFKNFEGTAFCRKFAFSNTPTWPKRYAVYSMYLFGLLAIICALAEPYIHLPTADKQYGNIRLLFVVDVSKSMVYAEDIKPNRLLAVKDQIKKFYLQLDGTYECSILPFAGDANPYFCPFTSDKKTFIKMLEELNWDSAPELGTDLTAALDSIEKIYIGKDKIDKSGLNLVLLFSDGGKEEALATDRGQLIKVDTLLASKNFRIYTIGVGGAEPTPLVVRSKNGNFVRHIVDNKGNISYSQLDESILVQMATVGKGKYYNFNSSNEIVSDFNKLLADNRLDGTEKISLKKIQIQPYLFLLAACIILTCLFLNKV